MRQSQSAGAITAREETLFKTSIDRRSILTGTTAFGAASLLPRRVLAQATAPAARPGASLPARGEFVVRGAY
ncbi:MAG: hypothetical protein WBW61_02130, partial [Rhodanobacteraceae bacterium]